jgi:hypothetical protein
MCRDNTKIINIKAARAETCCDKKKDNIKINFSRLHCDGNNIIVCKIMQQNS